MDFLLWFMIGFILIGLLVFLLMKKRMETKLAHVKANPDSEAASRDTKHMVWWVWSVTAWGVVSIALVVWWFNSTSG
ncbi:MULTISPECIES: hypothetical protein [unclassified Planococcus (in: firmicutes)]|uniref:hypothetical protein n=1 Tax=unclassified Planococcus (in: firmicutes) TaxID=2662419 RepID=UPI000C33A6A9|nr:MULTISPECIES: hypothetical protein [unclassified Planococcus (in: firmicutes)]AUD13063.1 hypothetical protein CW734_04440 [Planococcus sp. MB-3u-03]PKG45453.1 hypothetical protein CXF66_12610 [Planococcus sp. Urea-trap-24]PKG88950.1 hypothetical protein CXF91_08925 [Planococcus sp. Urea-3u-39]PKH36318.1 hypothetical protein CXF77_14595 [Planococcus sp. MB-3u-09]